MAARRTSAPPPEAPVLTIDQMRRRIERLQSCIRELEALDLQKVQRRGGDPEVMRIEPSLRMRWQPHSGTTHLHTTVIATLRTSTKVRTAFEYNQLGAEGER
jgi:hypothetical protein